MAIITLSYMVVHQSLRRHPILFSTSHSKEFLMTSKLKTALIFVLPVVFLGLLNWLFLSLVDPEPSIFDTRVRYLDVPSNEKDRIDALPEIYIEGRISEQTVKEFKDTVSRHGLSDAKVVFDSGGGSLDDAIELGYLIRDLGFSTSVGGYTQDWDKSKPAVCFSACTAAFLGGKYRYFKLPSEFGVHQYRSVGIYNDYQQSLESAVQAYSGKHLRYIKDMDVDTEFYEKTVAQSNDDIELLSLDELIQMRIVNDGALPPEWELSVVDSKPVLMGRQDRIGQDGSTSIQCMNGVRIDFQSNKKGLTQADLKDMKFSLYVDVDEIDIQDKVNASLSAGQSSPLHIHFRPDSSLLMAILASDSFGLIYEDAQGSRFLQNIDIRKHRGVIGRFIRGCG